MACTLKPEQIKSVKGLGFLNNKGTDLFNARVVTVNGKITAEQTRIVADAAEKYGCGELEFTTRMSIEVRGIPFDKIEDFRSYIAKAGLETGGTGPLVRPVVSCKGTTCQYGLYDTFALSEKVHERFYKGYRQVKLHHKFKIATGGCPNNCIKPDLNDVGIVGQRIPAPQVDLCKGCKKCQMEIACPMGAAKVVDGKIQIDEDRCTHCGRCRDACPFGVSQEGQWGYKVYVGGRWGKETAVARAIDHLFATEEEVLNFVEKAILFYKEQGVQGERFSQTLDRIGFEKAQKEMLSDDLLNRKMEILGQA